jgi:hypothetical protein
MSDLYFAKNFASSIAEKGALVINEGGNGFSSELQLTKSIEGMALRFTSGSTYGLETGMPRISAPVSVLALHFAFKNHPTFNHKCVDTLMVLDRSKNTFCILYVDTQFSNPRKLSWAFETLFKIKLDFKYVPAFSEASCFAQVSDFLGSTIPLPSNIEVPNSDLAEDEGFSSPDLEQHTKLLNQQKKYKIKQIITKNTLIYTEIQYVENSDLFGLFMQRYISYCKSLLPGAHMFGLDKLTNEIAETRHKVDDFMDRVENIFKGITSVPIANFAVLGVACYAMYAVIKYYCDKESEHLKRVISMLPLALFGVSDAIRNAYKFLTEPKNESLDDLPWSSITSLLLLATSSIAGAKNFKFNIKDVMSNLANLPKATQGFKFALDSGLEIINYCINYVREHILNMEPILDCRSNFPQVQTYFESVSVLVNRSFKNELTVNLENYDSIIRMQIVGVSIIAYERFGDQKDQVHTRVKYFLALLDKIRRPFDQSTIKSSFNRVEPLTILIRGESGVGKSVLSKPFLASLLANILPREDLPALKERMDQFIYVRNVETAYWDGYRGQFATVMDDFAQCVDVAGNLDNEYMALIRATSSFPYVLHMASLNEKGSNIFTSKVMFCTTNEINFHTVQSIKSKEALIRRFDFIVDVRVNPEPGPDGKPYGKVRLGDPGVKMDIEQFSKESWVFDVMEGVSSSSKGSVRETLSFEKFVEACSQRYFDKVAAFEHVNVECDDILARAIEKRKQIQGYMDYIQMDGVDDLTFDDDIVEPIYSEFSMDKVRPDEKDAIQKLIDKCVGVKDFSIKQACIIIDYLTTSSNTWKELIGSKFKENLPKLIDKLTLPDIQRILKLDLPSIMNSKIVACLGYFKACLDRANDTLVRLNEQYPFLKYAAMLSTIISAVGVLIYTLWPTNMSHKPPSSDIYRRTNKRVDNFSKIKEYISAQAKTDDDIIRKIISKNSLILQLPDCTTKSGVITVLAGSVAILPTHYFTFMQSRLDRGVYGDFDSIRLLFPNGELFKDSSVREFLDTKQKRIEQSDLTLFLLPGQSKIFPNILRLFCTKEDLRGVENVEAKFVNIDIDSVHVSEVDVTICKNGVIYNAEDDKVQCSLAAKYNCDSDPGDCGSLLMAKQASMYPRPLLGIHVAGSKMPLFFSDVGYCALTTAEDINLAVDAFNLFDIQSPPDSGLFVDKDVRLPPGNFRALGKAIIPIHQATKSQFSRIHCFYGMFGECDVAPAQLARVFKEGYMIDPLDVAISGYNRSIPYVFEPALLACSQSLTAHITMNSTKFEPEIYSFDVAVSGIAGVDFIDGISRATSAGYPHSREKNSAIPGKKAWFGYDGDYQFTSKECEAMRSLVKDVIDKARKGVRSLHIYTDHLKDELRPLEKVADVKTRLISGAPLQYIIAVRMYFLSFSKWIMDNRIKNGFAMGVNPTSDEWTHMVKYLHEVGHNLIAGDYSGFDKSANISIGNAIVDIINQFYDDGPENALIRRTLFIEVYNSVHIKGAVVYTWHTGMPSGNPLTTLVNCFYNALVIRLSWISCNGRQLSSIKGFNTHVRLICYGDDNIISVDDASKEFFSPAQVAEALLEFNLKYTSEDKDEHVDAFRTIDQVSFLKRYFVKQPEGFYLAPLDWNVVKRMMYYCRGGKHFKSNVQQCYESFLTELSLHEEENYNDVLSKIAPKMLENFGYVSDVTDFTLRRADSLKQNLGY